MKSILRTRSLLFFTASTVALLLANTSHAVPYASAVTNNAGTVSFVLNEDADNVKVVFDNGTSTNDLGALPKGKSSFSMGGATSFQIVVTKAATPGWTQTSNDTNVLNQFFQTRGVAVNMNPTNAALFGRTYISTSTEGNTSITGARRSGDGIYILNADQSDALNRGNNVSTAGINFSPTAPVNDTQWTPWRMTVGPDNNLYIADYSTNRGTIYRTDPDVTTNVFVLEGQGVGTGGASPNPVVHTTISGLAVKGSLENGDLEIQAIDGNTGGGAHFQWQIGSGPLPWNSAPNTLGSAGSLGVAHLVWDIDFGPDGKVYTSFYRLNNASANLRVFDTDGNTKLWDSLTDNGGSDPFSPAAVGGVQGIKVSPDGTKIACARSDNWVFIVPLNNGIPDVANMYNLTAFPSTPTSSSSHDVAWDAAGNLYVVTPSREALRVFSPGGTSVAITGGDLTGTNGTFSVTNSLPVGDPYMLVQPLSLRATLNATTQPGGGTILFSGLAGGTGPFTYQWQKDGGNIASATATSYQVATATLASAGEYRLVATGANGTVTSAPATLNVATNPVVLGGASSLTVQAGSNAVFSVNVIGVTPLTYQWYFNQVAVGTNGPIYTRTICTPSDRNGQVYATINNSYGSATSAVATLTVVSEPVVITLQPLNVVTNAGTNATFIVAATGIPAPSYQWRFNGANIAGQTKATLIRTNVQTTTLQGYYSVVVSNAVSTVTSDVVTLTVIDGPPVITRQPSGISTNAGASAVFNVITIGSDARTYQWTLNGTNIMGATTSTYTRVNAQQETAGDYRVLIANYFGSVLSDPANLNVVDGAPTIFSSSVSRNVAAGTNVLFTATTRGTDPRTYQWTFNGSPISYATNSAFTLTNAQAADSGTYVLDVNNTFGTGSTTNITLNVTNTPVRIITQPANRSVGAGQDSVFTVTTFGNDVRDYQWYRNSNPIAGATSNVFTFTNAQLADSGSIFYAIITNSLNTVQTTNAVLTVTNRVPTILVQPTNVAAAVGGSASFSVVAQGEAPLTYQWRIGTNNISGETGSSITLNNVQLSNAATNYNVVVSSSGGSTTSLSAQLAVTTATTPGTGIGVLAAYFADQYLTASVNSNLSFIAAPTVTKVETNIDFTFGTLSPDPSVPPDFFLARWTGQLQPLYSQVYTFYTKSDDGIRLWVNNQLLIDHWQSGGNQNYSYVMSNAFVAGQKYDVRVEYIDITAGGEAHLYWSSDSQIKEPIATTQLYTNSGPYLIGIYPPSLTMNAGESATPAFTAYAGGTGPLTYQWRFNGNNIGGATSSALNLNNVQAGSAGIYSVVVTGSLGATTNTYPVTLIVPSTVTPGTGTGLTGEYFTSKTSTSIWYTNTPTLSRLDSTVDFAWGSASPDLSISADTFISRWTGKVQAQLSEIYTFQVSSDDGARLWVDGQLLIDSWIAGGTNTSRVGIMPYAFVAGQKYDIRLEVYENTGAAEAHLRWSAPNLANEIIPITQLYPSSGPYVITQTGDQSVAAGTDAVFTAITGGTGVLTYQWKKNGANISGATTSALTLA